MNMGAKGPRSLRLKGLLFSCLALAIQGAPLPLADYELSPDMSPLIAGQMTWEVNKNFMTGTREVQLTLFSAFEQNSACTYEIESKVECDSKPNGAADVHGVICVKMVKQNGQQVEILTPHLEGQDGKLGPCPYVWDSLSRANIDDFAFAKCTDPTANSVEGLQDLWDDVVGRTACWSNISPNDNNGYPYNNANIGIENNFQVLSVHDKTNRALFDRKINNKDLVVGVKRVTVDVPPEATGVWAYLSAPDGSVRAYEAGNLLKQCSEGSNANSICSFNTADNLDQNLLMGMKRTAANNWANPGFSDHKYWSSYLENAVVRKFDLLSNPAVEDPPRSDKHIPLSQLSPTLETYVPLCSGVNGLDLHCDSYPINNYFSPGVGFPLLVEVAVTPKALNLAKRNAYSSGFRASTDPVLVKTYDNDGHATSLYNVFNSASTMTNRTARCWNQDPTYDGSTWPTKVCFASNPESVLVEGKPCTTDAQCDGGTCGSTWSNCRVSFDYDRIYHNRGGSLVKLDFDWMPRFTNNGLTEQVRLGGYDTLQDPYFVPYPENAGSLNPDMSFTQHMLNVVDAPFFDVDNPAVARVDVARDHFTNNPSLLLKDFVAAHHETDQETGEFLLPYQQPAASAHLFATYACDAGSANQPPIFIDEAEFNLPVADARGLNHEKEALLQYTEHECVWNAPCVIDLYAADYDVDSVGAENALSDDTIIIESAPGRVQEVVRLANSPGVACEGSRRIHCQYQVPHDFDSSTQTFARSAIGKIMTACFVALDWHPDCTETTSDTGSGGRTKCTCKSLPYCIKIKILGRAPQWVSPTPMVLNSRDDKGVIQPYRTDIPACENSPITLPLQAMDPDGDPVRIFIRDVDVDNDMFSTDMFPFRPDGGDSNGDFFSSQLSESWAGLSSFQQTCGVFQGYGARRSGHNENQTNILASPSETLERTVKSLHAPYDPMLEFVTNPMLNIEYTMSLSEANGIDVIIWNSPGPNGQQCRFDNVNGEANFVCRERRSNVDQVICAYAYDNSKSVVNRWVGETNPNGDDIKMWRRDHSNGDLSSEQWCWRIVMAASPGFVTNTMGTSTPVNSQFLVSTYGSIGSFRLTTGDESSYRLAYLKVNDLHEDTFIAQDPNPKDIIEILVLEDPGIPRDLRIGRTMCLRRDSAGRPMCVAQDFITEWSSPVGMVTSECSKASRTLSWTPLPEESGTQYRVCMVAKDDSQLCEGISTDATSNGWYGETLCLVYDVRAPELEWSQQTEALFTDTEVYVGCMNEFVFVATDISHTVNEDNTLDSNRGGNYPVLVSAGGEMLEGAEYVSAPADISSNLTVRWRADRTYTGRTMRLCVVANDIHNMRSKGKRCVGGLHDGLPCGGMPDDCGLDGGTCSAFDSCVTITIARCRYCPQTGESIAEIMREFAFDNNWLRLWALNGNDNGPNFPALKNPDLIGPGRQDSHLFLGVTYRMKNGERLADVASRFRTTVKSILTLNYDIDNAESIQTDQEVCIVPCSNADSSVSDEELQARG